ncbi:fatty acyl-AMP ligase [Rhodococcus fascians]|nr:fatty acyl-AMP ligase [Rhodococcus fascians]MBY4022465.1 fatty acyl-AMP ligase [Rhodococcus fascians]
MPKPVDTKPLHDFVSHFRGIVDAHSDRLAISFLSDRGEPAPSRSSTFGELDTLSDAVARRLRSDHGAGERALLLFAPGQEFLYAFLGCLYAQVIAVPAPVPTDVKGMERLGKIVRDSEVGVLLTTDALRPSISAWLTESGLDTVHSIIAVDAIDVPDSPQSPLDTPTADTVAFLQYTSGSTTDPKGVVITHRNLMANQREIHRVTDATPNDVAAGWLPHFHDMGLIGQLLHPLYIGFPGHYMSPVAFLKRPMLWLETLSRFSGTMTVAPNFAFEMCTKRITDEILATLNLSRVRVILNGSEPVHPRTLVDFCDRFSAAGLDPKAVYPCYGLAEATLLVSGVRGTGFTVFDADSDALERHEIRAATDPGSVRSLVGSGVVGESAVAIVDPATSSRLDDGHIGEIWVRGETVAQGYWKNDEATAATFDQILNEEKGYMRTGDLGCFIGAELFVTGRLKDVIIVNGKNHYPHDLEQTAKSAHPAVEQGLTAAFGMGEFPERVVLVQEFSEERLGTLRVEDLKPILQEAIRQAHGLILSEIVLVDRKVVARTTSGKIRRAEMRDHFRAGRLADRGLAPTGAPAQ